MDAFADDTDLDTLPSYDFATSLLIPSSSSSSNAYLRHNRDNQSLPKHLQHLFSSPPNLEPLLGRASTPQHILDSIQVERKGIWILSWDSRLSNPTVLYDWLRSQALQVPTIKLHCVGTHVNVPDNERGDSDHNVETNQESERSVDFDFTVDLTHTLNHTENKANIHLHTVEPNIAANRGSHDATYGASYAPAPSFHNDSDPHSALLAECSTTARGRVATRTEQKIIQSWIDYRSLKGLPRWMNQRDCEAYQEVLGGVGKGKLTSTNNGAGAIALDERECDSDPEQARGQIGEEEAGPKLMEWCKAYCADQGFMKSFMMRKMIWGWDLEGLGTAIKGAISSTGYKSEQVKVVFEVGVGGIIVMPNNILSRIVWNPMIYALMWLTLIYPLLWLWQHFVPGAGGPYTVARCTYAMKYYPPLPTTYPNEPLSTAQNRLPSLFKTHPELPHPTKLQLGPKGVHYLLGRREGEWFKEWEERIKTGVRLRFSGVLEGGEGEEGAGRGLDGYEG